MPVLYIFKNAAVIRGDFLKTAAECIVLVLGKIRHFIFINAIRPIHILMSIRLPSQLWSNFMCLAFHKIN